MFLKRLHTSKKQEKDLISWRGHEVTRIEAFSDAVFAFAITLLIVSLEVPKSFEELMQSMKGFFPFAISFIMFFQIWVTQNLFFRRYGMHDEGTLFLNAALLFMVLFFVYPMKFLWNILLLSPETLLSNPDNEQKLFYIYSGGFSAIYILFALMYWHAYRNREHLKLTESEAFETKTYTYRNLSICGVGLLSVLFTSFGKNFLPLAGIIYALTGPLIALTQSRRKKLHRKKFGALYASGTPVHEPKDDKVEAE